MIYLLIFLAFAISIVFSMLIIPRILIVALKKKLFDIPDKRKVHTGAIPRLGGISFAPTILFSLSFVSAISYIGYIYGYEVPRGMLTYIIPEFYLLVCGIILLYLAGIKDDLVGMHYTTKFLIQLIAASLLPLSGLWINNLYGLFGIQELIPWIGIPLTILTIIFITNAINLIDGIDGLASGLSGSALLILGSLFLLNKMWMYTMLAFATLGVLIPFFYYNVFGQAEHGRKIFMGDTGSLTLGYILAFLVIRYSSYNPDIAHYSEGAIVIAFSTLIVPLFDVIRVMIVRAKNHKGLFTPDKNHIHHRFLEMGITPHKTMFLIILISCIFSSLNILMVSFININLLFAGDIFIWIGISIWLEKVRCNKTIKRKGVIKEA
ncbi:MraY family glycosyltransferase [Parabacteroides sp. AM08-6]|uniref:MraY family glycosyltransferase n=1 Tax=Parabacteroides sp. AM08-6 TaxID=2292053 RepID=UPI000EFF6AE8|nr:MraY family glycosyltransferase [Parabacteroides sp. AM08-6]RHJ85287.1 undecaprenyl/decaprenyl-phosphate alpha-N-acetylglucosaminyl 1-phosphate transferase [Parabacteroides sp. AM08-6]